MPQFYYIVGAERKIMAEENVPVPAASAPSAQPAKKKSNTALIVVIVIVVILVLIGVGSFFAFNTIKNRIFNGVQWGASTTNSTSGGSSSSNSSSGESSKDEYSSTKDQTPTTDFGKQVNSDVKAALKSIYGDVKLGSWVSFGNNSASLGYVTRKDIQVGDLSAIKSALSSKGYSGEEQMDYTTSDGFMLTMKKGSVTLVITYSDSEKKAITATATKE